MNILTVIKGRIAAKALPYIGEVHLEMYLVDGILCSGCVFFVLSGFIGEVFDLIKI